MILPSLQTSTCPKQNQKSEPTDLIHEKEPSIHPKLQGCKTIPVTTDAQRGMGKNYLGPPRWMINNSKNDQLDANGSLPVCTFCCFLHVVNTHDLRNNTTIRSTRWFIQPGGLNLWCSNQQWTCPQVSTCGNTHSLGLIIPACPYSDQIQ